MVVKVDRKVWDSMRILCNTDFEKLQQRYEWLVNLVAAYGGRVHGSQHNSTPFDGESYETIAIYFQIPMDAKKQFDEEYNSVRK